jgi:predicted GNAT family N-acyltransferase
MLITEIQYNKLMEGYVNFPIDDEVALEVWEDDNKIELLSIVLPHKKRGKGYGSDIIEMVCDYADNKKKPIYLTPSKDFGATSVDRLKRFYKRFGFIRNTDYEVSHSMVRYPEIY